MADEIMNTSRRIREIMQKALLLISNNPDEITNWLNLSTKNIKILNKALKKCELNIGEKRHLEHTIGILKGYQTKIKNIRHRGAGINSGKKRGDRVRWEDVQSAFKGRVRTGVVINLKHKDPQAFLEDARFLVAIRVKKLLKKHNMLKINVDFGCSYTKAGLEEVDVKHFNTRNSVIDGATDLKRWWEEHVRAAVMTQMEEFQFRDSGWTLDAVVNLAVNINKYEPLRGSSYIPLPEDIQAKKACVNVQNEDNACFYWSIVSSLHPASRNSHRVSSYPHYSEVLNLEGLELPMTLRQVSKFEKLNDISVNVYVLEKSGNHHRVLLALLTKNKRNRHVNLLMVQSSYKKPTDDTPVSYHFCWVKNLSRLVRKQATAYKGLILICERCMQYFYTKEKLQRHEEDCIGTNECRVTMPAKGEVVKFKNYNNKERVPFVIYMDIESLLKPVDKKRGEKTTVYQEHEAFSLGYYFKCEYDQSLSYYKSYRGLECAKWFACELRQIAEDVEPVYWAMQPMKLTLQEEHDFHQASNCHICNKPFSEKNFKVRDHNHITGDFRGAAHNSCNLNYKDRKSIPVICHNLSGYDAHFIIKNIAQEIEGSIFILPVNKDRYISFTKSLEGSAIKFKFIDSFRFMPYALDQLVSYLDDLKIVRSEYPDERQLKLLRRKGVFPYDYVQCRANLEELKLPEKSDFYSKLREEAISDEDYNHAQKVWTEFAITTLGEYSDLYLKTDVLLLADVFENFRDTCYKIYGLDAAHYITAPSLTWDSMLKYTNVELDLLTEIDMLMFVERGIRGGISQCSNRFARANNHHMSEYDPRKESVYIQYLDVNNLYGFAMSQALPSGGFKWCRDLNIDVTTIPDDYQKGYILEVDLQYPQDLHDLHNDLPFCPEQMIPPGSKTQKLLTTLYDKDKYIIHYRALKQALHHGIKIKKIHRVLEFNQSAWLKPYIDLNTSMRTKARNEFEKTFYKLMNNSVFGKTMENLRNRKTVKLITKWDGRYSAKVLIAKPNFHSRVILDEDCVIIEMTTMEIVMNKPLYVGMAILDISKICLYSFHYDFMANLGYDNKVMYCDTDSLIYQVKCPDFYAIMKKNIQLFDTSDYPPNNIHGIPLANKKVPGLMKDEMNAKIITDFVGLRSKMYSVRVGSQKTIKKAKGVKGYVVKKNISFNDYINCLVHKNNIVRDQNSIRSMNHNVVTIKQTKLALSANDDKRKLIEGSFDTFAWGHWRIMN